MPAPSTDLIDSNPPHSDPVTLYVCVRDKTYRKRGAIGLGDSLWSHDRLEDNQN